MAEGLDQALREEVATRTDVAAVRADLAADIAAVRSDLGAEIAAVRGDLAAVRHELKADNASLRQDLQVVKHDMLRWMVGMSFAQIGLIVALVRFLPH